MWSLLFSLKKVFAKNTIILINLSFSLQLFSCFQSTTPLNSQPTQTSLVAKLQNLCQKVDQVIFKLLKRAPLFVENYLLILYLRQNVQNNQYRSYFPSVDLGILEMANGRQYRNANHIIYHMIYAYQSSSLNYLGKALKTPPPPFSNSDSCTFSTSGNVRPPEGLVSMASIRSTLSSRLGWRKRWFPVDQPVKKDDSEQAVCNISSQNVPVIRWFNYSMKAREVKLAQVLGSLQ